MLEVKFGINWAYGGQTGGETFFHTAIGNFMSAMRDWSYAFRDMVEEVLEPAIDEQYETLGHNTWADLVPSTIAAKERMGYWGGRMGILTATGALHSSFHEGDPNNVFETTRQSLRWGSRLPYALFHQTGTGSGFQSRSKGLGPGMPMRKLIDLTERQKRAMRSIFVRRLATIARREGFAAVGGDLGPLGARKFGGAVLGL